MIIYEKSQILESNNFLIRPVEDSDLEDLFRVYSDERALPYFNSDNCDGDNFYYSTIQKMKEVLEFWKQAFENRWFARMSIVSKFTGCVIGTVELCLRVSDDDFNNTGILRVDLISQLESAVVLEEIFKLVTPKMPELVGCSGVITKGPLYAIDRVNALKNAGYKKSESYLIGKNGLSYDQYWIFK